MENNMISESRKSEVFGSWGFFSDLFLFFEAACRQFIQRSLQYRYLKNVSLHVKLNWV